MTQIHPKSFLLPIELTNEEHSLVADRLLRRHCKFIITVTLFYYHYDFLDVSEKLRKATTSFVMSVRTSVRMEQLGSHWKDFH